MNNISNLLLDAGTGNLHSVYHTLNSLGADVIVSENPELIPYADRIILPGVGSFAKFMSGINQKGLISPIIDYIQQNRPLLGICVGMQALFEFSEEMGDHRGLGLLSGKVKKFPIMKNIKIPHTGWNQIWFTSQNPLLNHIKPGDYVYFNHSYYCIPGDQNSIAASTDYGIDFCSVIHKNNLFGVQFHPEKSQRIGLQILRNFIAIDGDKI